MLYGVGLGLDKELVTLRAVKVIEEADEVIVPGKMAYDIVRGIREPRIVEFPMGKGEKVAKDLAEEFAKRNDENIAFCCIGDPAFYSTFHHVVEELLKIKPDAELELVPGVSSISCALAKSKTFVNNSALITTQSFGEADVAVVLKVKKPREAEMRLRELGFSKFVLLENMFTDGEKIYHEMPESASYFSVLVARK